MDEMTVYSYQDARQYLLDTLGQMQKSDSSFSVRKWAKKMEMKSHSLLVMLLQGKRELRVHHCDFLFKGLPISSEEKIYFQSLIHYQCAKTIAEKKVIAEILSVSNPLGGVDTKEIDQFKVISDWIHMAILAMTQLKSFKGTEEEIYSLLKEKVTLSEIRSSMVRLLDLGLLEWNENGQLVATFKKVTTRNDVADAGVKEYHKQILELAKNAVDEQSLEQREFQSFTIAVDKEKIPMAKKMIREFRAKLNKLIAGDGDYVYQTAIQFFQLTKNDELEKEATKRMMVQ